MHEKAQTCVARARVQVDSCDTSVYLCGMPYGSGRPQVQGESHLLANGGPERDSRDGLVVRQPFCHRLRTTQGGIPRDNRTGVDRISEGDEGSISWSYLLRDSGSRREKEYN